MFPASSMTRHRQIGPRISLMGGQEGVGGGCERYPPIHLRYASRHTARNQKRDKSPNSDMQAAVDTVGPSIPARSTQLVAAGLSVGQSQRKGSSLSRTPNGSDTMGRHWN